MVEHRRHRGKHQHHSGNLMAPSIQACLGYRSQSWLGHQAHRVAGKACGWLCSYRRRVGHSQAHKASQPVSQSIHLASGCHRCRLVRRRAGSKLQLYIRRSVEIRKHCRRNHNSDRGSLNRSRTRGDSFRPPAEYNRSRCRNYTNKRTRRSLRSRYPALTQYNQHRQFRRT